MPWYPKEVLEGCSAEVERQGPERSSEQ